MAGRRLSPIGSPGLEQRETRMETFIVRIYRGITTSAQELGTVERVGSGDRVGFSGREQLLGCLLVAERRSDGDDCFRGRDDATGQGEAR